MPLFAPVTSHVAMWPRYLRVSARRGVTSPRGRPSPKDGGHGPQADATREEHDVDDLADRSRPGDALDDLLDGVSRHLEELVADAVGERKHGGGELRSRGCSERGTDALERVAHGLLCLVAGSLDPGDGVEPVVADESNPDPGRPAAQPGACDEQQRDAEHRPGGGEDQRCKPRRKPGGEAGDRSPVGEGEGGDEREGDCDGEPGPERDATELRHVPRCAERRLVQREPTRVARKLLDEVGERRLVAVGALGLVRHATDPSAPSLRAPGTDRALAGWVVQH